MTGCLRRLYSNDVDGSDELAERVYYLRYKFMIPVEAAELYVALM